jgi:malonyl-CoA/methylmalonyl-CoA synthetase
VVAVVVPEAGAIPDPAALLAGAAATLAPYKRPKHVAVVAELPRNAMGKVQKNLLRSEYAALFAGAAREG